MGPDPACLFLIKTGHVGRAMLREGSVVHFSGFVGFRTIVLIGRPKLHCHAHNLIFAHFPNWMTMKHAKYGRIITSVEKAYCADQDWLITLFLGGIFWSCTTLKPIVLYFYGNPLFRDCLSKFVSLCGNENKKYMGRKCLAWWLTHVYVCTLGHEGTIKRKQWQATT